MGCQNMSKNACYRFRRQQQQPHRRSRLLTLFFCVLELHVQNGICLLFIFQQNKGTIPRIYHRRLSNAKFLWLWGWNIDTSSPRLKQLKWPYRILCLPAFDMGRTLEVSLQSSIVNGMKWNDTLIEAKENVCRIVWLVAYAAGGNCLPQSSSHTPSSCSSSRGQGHRCTPACEYS